MSQATRPSCGPECEAALERLEAYLDGELPEVEVSSLAAHLQACYPCTDRASFEEQLRALLRERCRESAPTELAGRIRAQLASDLGTPS